MYDGMILKQVNQPQIMKGSDIGIQEKKAKLYNEWKRFTSTDGESIESYYHSDESLAKHNALELEIKHLLRAVVSQDVMSIVQNNSVVDTSNLQTELKQCKYDKISYDKAYNDMQQKIKQLQAQLGDQKGISKDTPCVSNTLDPLPQKLENENMEVEFQIRNYEKENAHLKAVYKNLFDSINVTRAQTKTIIDSLQTKLHDTIYENAKLRAQLFDKVSDRKDTTKGTSVNTQFCKQSILGKPHGPKVYSVTHFPKTKGLPKIDEAHALSKSVTSNLVPTTKESKVVDNDKVIAPGMSNTKNDRVPSASKSSRIKNKEVKVEVHPRNLLLSKNKKHMSSECNNIKLAIRNDKSEIICAMCKQCLITTNHDACVLNYVNGMDSHGKKKKANVLNTANQMKDKVHVWKPKRVRSKERLASPKPSKPCMRLRWSPTGKMFDINGKIIASSKSNGENACTPNPQEPTIKRFPNSTFFLGRNDHVAAILGFNLEVDFRRNTCFIRNLKGVDLLKGNRTINLYTINLHDMASASPICLMARATSTKSWLWHQRLSHLNFDTINDLARNDLVTGLPKIKYHKEHLCPSCEQGKSKRASHPPKPVPNSKQRLHLFHMDLCGPMRIASINGKRVGISHQASSVRTPQQNGVVEQRNCTLVEAARTMLIFSRALLFLWAEAIATACYTQNCSVIHRRLDKTPYEFINGRKLNISFLHVFRALYYPKNDHEDIRKLGAKGDIGFFIGYSANSCAYRVYNRRPKKIIETMNVTFDKLLAMAFEQSSLRPGLQSMTSGQITMYDDYIGGQPSAAPRTIPAAHAPQVLQFLTTTTTTADTAPTPTNSLSLTTNIPSTSQNVDKLERQPHGQPQPASIADNMSNAMFNDNTFVNPFATPSTSAADSSSSQYVDPSNMHTFYQPHPHEYQWTKDHPLEQVIAEPSRPVLTRNQLRSDGDMCMYALTVSTIEPKNVNEAMTDPAWIESMQEELLQFKRL
ncbi:putative ribonuclease H-like domain-containing protein, partial [Tanacetum coccineum]